jgi:hypothetical protein
MCRLAVLVLAMLLLAAPAAADVSGPEIVGYVNAVRDANGIPAGIAEDASNSDACAKHNNYGHLNNVLTHSEDPLNPGYTPEGDQVARVSVLYAGSDPWTASHNPFETAPIHLHQLLAPRVDRMGASENFGYGCATTLASRGREPPGADVTYTYPGDGRTDWPAGEVAAEGPYTPGQLVGIPAGTLTGPYLLVSFDGPDLTPFDTARVTNASLSGPTGLVDIAVVDNTTGGLEGFLPPGMQVIPRQPLEPRSSYTATVSADVTSQGGSGPSRSFDYTWSFTTGTLPNHVRITGIAWGGRTITVTVSSDAPNAWVDATGPGTDTSATVGPDGRAELTVDADGSWELCARSGGEGTSYAAAEDCTTVELQPFGSQGPGSLTFARPAHFVG